MLSASSRCTYHSRPVIHQLNVWGCGNWGRESLQGSGLGLVTGEVTYGVDRQTYEFRFDLPVTLVAMIDAGGGEE
jgi:hypothetical protein